MGAFVVQKRIDRAYFILLTYPSFLPLNGTYVDELEMAMFV
jgi:hypothetical protein